ncbi:ABC transporter ATP-binding protein [Streptomyces sp. NPDC051985]|uniref:ABC transporter ATP-binding protein n=1 Tax=Streptomyces sp. NPDC051985 TaxID=3155807 RepID=UPI00343DD1FA
MTSEVAPKTVAGDSGQIASGRGPDIPQLELRGITAGYGSSSVLTDIDLSVPKGRIVALLGPNGAGKTTTLRTAAGLVRPSAGQVFLDGVDITALAPYRRAELGLCLIPEGRGIFRSLTVEENLRVQCGRRGNTAEAAERAVAVFPALRTRMRDLAGRLSGGQQQMLALARAYVANPALVVLDEVSMGLAPRVVEEIFTALRELATAGVAMLLVEQYVTRALEMADTVVLLDKGSVAFAGPAKDLDEETVLRGYLGVVDIADAAS